MAKKPTEKKKRGRPLLFKTTEELESKGLNWIKTRQAQNKPVTITGLAVELNTSRETLMRYERKDEFYDTVKRLKGMCEAYAEDQIFAGKNPSGGIFALKNYGWSDKQQLEHSGDPETLTDEQIQTIINRRAKSVSDGREE